MASIIKVDQIQTAAGGTPTAADLGLSITGNILQVVQSSTTSSVAVSSTTTYTDTGLSGSITPTSATSKILILTSEAGYARRDASDGTDHYCRLLRSTDSTELADQFGGARATTGYAGELYAPMTFNFSYLDSPNTTSEVSYKTQGKQASGYTGSNSKMQFMRTRTMTLIEIAG